MAAVFSEKSKAVYNYVKENESRNITAPDIANALEMDVRSVNGIVTLAFGKKGLMERIPAEIELQDGSHKAVKLIRLTEAGRNVDINAVKDE